MKSKLTIALLLLAMLAPAQRVVSICGDYTYYPPENISIEQAKQVAIERAKIAALEDEFGRVVSQSNTTTMQNNNGASDVKYYFLGGSEVKGDWIADTKIEVTPNYVDGTLVINAHVCGKGREITTPKAELQVQTLCNGIASENFKDKDLFTMHLKSSAAGYAAIFFFDQNTEKVYCLLPYWDGDGKAREIKARKEYTFFSAQDPAYPQDNEDMYLEADTKMDMNHIFVVFSAKQFSMPLTQDGEIPELSFADYNKWLQKNRVKDETMLVVERVITITK